MLWVCGEVGLGKTTTCRYRRRAAARERLGGGLDAARRWTVHRQVGRGLEVIREFVASCEPDQVAALGPLLHDGRHGQAPTAAAHSGWPGRRRPTCRAGIGPSTAGRCAG